jgi:DNA-cytosine methyltransferase
MNVLSLFDGMSCGMIALDRLGIKVDNYYASEIDKYAMQVSAANYPEIIQVGDITKLDLSTLPKIDLVMGGSPCQGFSFAGKQLAFDDPRSALFFEFVKCVEALKPKYFLLENVKMKKEYLDIISEYMGVEPIFIQSSLVSAQSRQRYYWTNIPGIEQPEERGIVLRDILEDQVGSEHYVGDNMQKNYKGGNQLNPNYKSQANTIHNEDKKSGTICAGTHGYANGYVGDKHKPVKHTERNARHLKQLDEKSLCMTATMYKGAGNNGMTLVPQKLVDDTSDLPEKSQTIKSQYYKSSKANFEREGTFHATGIPQKLVSDKPQHKELDHLKQFKIKDETVPKYVPNEEGDFCDPYNKKMIKGDKSTTLRTNSSNGNTWVKQIDKMTTKDGKAYCVTASYTAAEPKNSIERKQRTMIPLEDGQELPENITLVYDNDGKSHKPQHIGTAVDINGHDVLKRVYSPDGKSPTVTTCGGGHREPKVVVQSYREVRTEEAKRLRRESKKNTGKDHTPFRAKKIVPREDGKVGTVTPGLNNDHMISLTRDKDQEVYWRKLTPLECERLQTVPDNYTNHVSNTQRYKMLGNGWTIEVIAHIFKNMEVTS